MGIGDKLEHKAEELKGSVKEQVGDATDDREMHAEGTQEKWEGKAGQAGEKIKDIGRRIGHGDV